METPPEDMYAMSEAVFRGSTLNYFVVPDGESSYYVHTFLVTACWKGDVESVIQLHSLVSEAGCGVFLPVGADRLVYAYENAGTYSTNLCSVISPLNSIGQEHLAWLGEPSCGTVSTDANSWGGVKALYR